MDFDLPPELVAYLAELDRFIEATIKPLEESDDNVRFFDHRREWARTDFENGGLPRHDWEELLSRAVKLADEAGYWRFSAPAAYGGKDGSNLWMAVIRDHLAARGWVCTTSCKMSIRSSGISLSSRCSRRSVRMRRRRNSSPAGSTRAVGWRSA